jgi:DNA end-binding protein Ku
MAQRDTSGKGSTRSTKRPSATKRRTDKKPQRRSSPATAARDSALGARPVWSGNLRLALVSVPVKLYPATRSGARISFHQVHEPTGKRIRYSKVVPGIGPVDTDEIVSGFAIGDDKYVLLEKAEIDALKIEARKTLDLVQFVQQGEIDPIWFDRPYYVVADGELAEEAYGVLRDALRATQRVGLGQFVMRGREYVAGLKACGGGLLLETLRFADEVRKAAPFFAELGDVEPDDELLGLARELIERKSAAFDPHAFHDHYTEALRELIDSKAKRGKPVQVPEGEPERGGKVVDLVEALKKSVGEAKRAGGNRQRMRDTG